MAQLGDFVGALLADAVQARVRADFEALKVAEAYSGNELLKHLPVPRFRLPDISIEFPVLVTGISGETGTPRLFNPPTNAEILDVVRRSLESSNVTLSDQQRATVASAAQRRSAALFKVKETGILRSFQVAQQIALTTAAEVAKSLPESEGKEPLVRAVDSAVRTYMRHLLTKKIAQSPHVRVAATSAEIKEHGDNDSVMRVRLTITEDAFELVERDGGGYMLVPE
jgi:hypothetical protein